MIKLNLQMYSFGSYNPDETKEQLEAAAKMGYSGVELFGPNLAHSAEELKSWLDEYGLVPLSFHVNTDQIESMIPYAKTLGLKFMGIGMEYLPDEASVYAYAKTLNELGAKVRAEGMTLTYHNHTQEFKQYGDKNILEILLANTDPENLSLELDAGWCAGAGADPFAFVEKYGERIKLIHIKESKKALGVLPQNDPSKIRVMDADGNMVFSEEFKKAMEHSQSINCPAGEGLVDWKALKELADSKGCQAYTVERERSYAGTRIDCLTEDFKYYSSIL